MHEHFIDSASYTSIPQNVRVRVLTMALVAMLLFFSGCDADTVGVNHAVASLSITPPTASVLAGASITLQARALDADGHDVTNVPISWISSAPTVATVSNTGRVTTLSPGTVRIIAEAEGARDTAFLSVSTSSTQVPLPAGVVASHDFEDGTLGPFTTAGSTTPGETNANIFVIDDPTSQFRGKILNITYVGQSDVNRSIRLRNFTRGLGETVYFRGSVLIPLGSDTDMMRKLLYFQTSTNNGFVVVRLDGSGGTGLSWKTETNTGIMTGGGAASLGRKYVLEVEVTMNSAPGVADGIFRQWVDGRLIYERTNLELLTADVKYNFFAVGFQAQKWDKSALNEVRYWDDIVFEAR